MFKEPLGLALRALEIKYQTIKQRLKEGLLPFLSQKVNGNQYLRLENASRLVSFVGLNETVQSFLGKSIYEDKATLDFAEQIVKIFSDTKGRYARKPETRVSLAMAPNPDAAQRLAELDIEKYGWGTVSVRGKKENPFYTDLVAAPLDAKITLEERLNIEERIHKLSSGGHLAILRLHNSEQSAEEFLSTTKLIVKNYDVGLYVYDRDITFCENCKENFYKVLFKCPRCGSANMLTSFGRAPARHLPMPFWGPAQRLLLDK
jgi:ribonucleoside-triphosphate reductase